MDTSSRPTNLEIITGIAKIPLSLLHRDEMWAIFQQVIMHAHPCVKYIRDLRTLGSHLEGIGTFEDVSCPENICLATRALCLDPSVLVTTPSKMLFLTENGSLLLYDAQLVVAPETRRIHQKKVTFHRVTEDAISQASRGIEPWAWLTSDMMFQAIFEIDNLFLLTIDQRERHLNSLRDRENFIHTVVHNINSRE